KTPSIKRHPFPLHKDAEVLAHSIGQHEPARLVALVEKVESTLNLLERLEEFVLRDTESKEKLRLPIEEERREAADFASADEIGEVDVRGQILPAGIGEQIARDALSCVRRGRAVAAQTRAEQRLLRISVVEGDDEPARDGAADLVVQRRPLERDIGEL